MTAAVDEGRAMHVPAAESDGDEGAEERSPDDLSSAALVASSVLAKHGSTAGQVRRIALHAHHYSLNLECPSRLLSILCMSMAPQPYSTSA